MKAAEEWYWAVEWVIGLLAGKQLTSQGEGDFGLVWHET